MSQDPLQSQAPQPPLSVTQVDIQQLEALLEELAQLAVQGIPESEFYASILGHLRSLLPCPSGWVLRPSTTGQWIPAHGVPSQAVDATVIQWATESASDRDASDRDASDRDASDRDNEPSSLTTSPVRCRQQGSSLACCFSARGNSLAVLVVSGLANQADSRHFSVQLVEAIAEICQEYERDQYIRRASQAALPAEEALKLTNDLLQSDSFSEACSVLANDACHVLGCDRLSVFEVKGDRVRPIAVTGADEFDKSSPIIKSLSEFATKCLADKKAIVIADVHDAESAESEELKSFQQRYRQCSEFSQLISFPLRDLEASRAEPDLFAVVVLENRTSTMQQHSHKWKETLPMVEQVLGQRHRSDAVPIAVRRFFTTWARPPGSRTVRFAILTGVLLLSATWFLSQPVTVIIEADGLLKPVVQRHVFAPADGRVTRIHVTDLSEVTEGQLVLELSSPSLTLKLSEIDGRIRTLTKKRDTLTVAVSQTTSNPQEGIIQTRIAAEIAEVDEEIRGLNEQRKIVEDELGELSVTSPLTGRVVNWNLTQSLKSRPVGRGDSLLKIANPNGGWRLELHVPDGESGHVRDALKDHESVQIDYVILSQPKTSRRAHLTKMARAVQHTPRSGIAIPVYADLDEETLPADVLADSAIRARIHCPQQPRGFVWFRKIIESLQRRFWL